MIIFTVSMMFDDEHIVFIVGIISTISHNKLIILTIIFKWLLSIRRRKGVKNKDGSFS